MTSDAVGLAAEEKPSLEQTRAYLGADQEALIGSVRAALQEHVSANRPSLSSRALDAISQAVVAAWRRFVAAPEAGPVQEYGAQLAQEGLGLPSATAMMAALRRTCWEAGPVRAESDRHILGALDGYEAAFLAGWVGATEQAIREERKQAEQEHESTLKRTISELSSPVIQVWEGVLVMPLVGVIDSGRARRMTEDLLNGIVTYQAEQVIIDITGVPVVDTGVANHLLQTIKAARLLGARCLLVGISSEVAQAMVHLGIDLSGVTTRANLQAGIEYVLAQMGLGVAPLTSET